MKRGARELGEGGHALHVIRGLLKELEIALKLVLGGSPRRIHPLVRVSHRSTLPPADGCRRYDFTMTAETLIALRRARKLSQRAAALAWGVTPNTVYRWEAGLRPIPAWVERMVERERPLLKRIESQEKEIAALLLKTHRELSDSPLRVSRDRRVHF
jgi:hypothetical protein